MISEHEGSKRLFNRLMKAREEEEQKASKKTQHGVKSQAKDIDKEHRSERHRELQVAEQSNPWGEILKSALKKIGMRRK